MVINHLADLLRHVVDCPSYNVKIKTGYFQRIVIAQTEDTDLVQKLLVEIPGFVYKRHQE